MPGPVPKRSGQLRQPRKSDRRSVDKGVSGGAVTVPDADPDWHPIAVQFWEALTKSGQSFFYEASDWALAFSITDDLSYYKKANKRSGQMLQTIYSSMERLLVAEGDRRRARLELERDSGEPVEDPGVAIMDKYRKAAQ